MAAVAQASEVHIAGVVVHAYPAALAAVERSIAVLPGVRVHATSPEGRLVVTLEAASAGAIAETMSRMQLLDGVLAAALVYQHCESEAAMNDEVES